MANNYSVSDETAKFIDALKALDNAANTFADAAQNMFGDACADNVVTEYTDTMQPLRDLIHKYLLTSIADSLAIDSDII